jgi:serine/threonine-protein kinase
MISNVVGNYQIRAKIGEGGMGSVFKGLDLMLEREVAIKVLRPELASQPQVVERFRAEAVMLARLNHPHIATLYNFLRHGDDYLMVMEFVRGETIESLIQRHGALPIGQSLRLFCQALEGIAQAHSLGIVHRDLKPSNLMLTETGTIKVMDFGIARVLGSARMTRTGRILGTIEYMSPEQVRGQETDARSDLYSLGIVLYEMLTGRVPFNSPSEFELMRSQIEDPPTPPREFAEHVPAEIEQIILRALAKDPAERFQSAGEFQAALMNAALALNLSLRATASDITALAAAQRTGDAANPPDAFPETRLGEGALHNFSASGGGDVLVKETRLGQANSGSHAASDGSAAVSNQSSLRQLTGRLTWKHYGAGTAAAVALVAAFILFDGEKKNDSLTDRTISTPANSSASSAGAISAPIVSPQPAVDTGGVQPATGVIVSNEAAQPSRSQRVVKKREPNPNHSSFASVQPTPPPAREREPEREQSSVERKKDKGSKWGRIFGGAVEVIGGTKDVIKDLKEKDGKTKDRNKKKN